MEQTNSIETTSRAIKNDLSGIGIPKAISEYIWNSFDAKASLVKLKFSANKLGGIVHLEIEDNGHGILIKSLPDTFGRYRDSIKRGTNSPTVKGQKGLGRFSFHKFAGIATWDSVAEDGSLTLSIDSSKLNFFQRNNLKDTFAPKSTGCRVSFSSLQGGGLTEAILIGEVAPYLAKEFSWLLKASDRYSLQLGGPKVALLDHNEDKSNFSFVDNTFDINLVEWEQKHATKSYIYFLDSNGEIKHKELSRGNLKHDFHISVYVSSDWFDDFIVAKGGILPDEKNLDSECFKVLTKHVRSLVSDYYRKCRGKAADAIIEAYEREGIFPEHNELSPALRDYQHQMLVDTIKVIYEAEPKIFGGKQNIFQKKVLIKLLDRLTLSSSDSLFQVLNGIVELEEGEMDRLAKLLERTSLGNITRAIEGVRERVDVIEIMRELHSTHRKNAGEVAHIQKVVENNLWLFGEQYHVLTAEEPKFEQALRKLFSIHGDSEHYQKGTIHHQSKNREMDIFAIRRTKSIGADGKHFFHCLVIELKRSQETLKDKFLRQIEDYQSVISSHKEFNDGHHKWDFVLVADKISDNETSSAQIRSRLKAGEIYGELGLIFKTDTCKVSVKTWGQIYSEHDLKHKHLLDNLLLQKQDIEGTPDSLTKKALKARELNTSDAPLNLGR